MQALSHLCNRKATFIYFLFQVILDYTHQNMTEVCDVHTKEK